MSADIDDDMYEDVYDQAEQAYALAASYNARRPLRAAVAIGIIEGRRQRTAEIVAAIRMRSAGWTSEYDDIRAEIRTIADELERGDIG